MTDLTRYMEPILEASFESKPFVLQYLAVFFAKLFELTLMAAPTGALTQLHLAMADGSSLENGAFYHPVG
eukprot:2568932-Ditylum_brightwellii.AAC.1